ncbi:MAG: hypothetical protein AAGG57_20100 [Pseudomonadota bacterium]
MEVHQETLLFGREFSATPDCLFKAYLDPKQREVWSAPTPETVIVINEADVQTGGCEIARCGSTENLSWTTKVAYHSLV